MLRFSLDCSLPCFPKHLPTAQQQHRETTLRRSKLGITRNSRVPSGAPMRTPSATGAAMDGWMSPREKNMPALAAAFNPTMKLLVVVDTLIGSRIILSITSTLKAPLPMPSIPEMTATRKSTPNAGRACSTR